MDEDSDPGNWGEDESYQNHPVCSGSPDKIPSNEEFERLEWQLQKKTLMTGLSILQIVNQRS